jgi:quercetin dioxygenase-like cupin family protein
MGGGRPAKAKFYRLADQKKIVVSPSHFRRGIPGIGANIVESVMKKGATFPMHAHVHEQFTMVISGAMRFTFEDGSAPITLHAGDVIHIPGDVPHAVEVLEDVVEYDVFCPARNNLVDSPA